MPRFALLFSSFLVCCYTVLAQTGENVLLVVNRANALSRRIADYYVPRRSIPLRNVCKLNIPEVTEEISWDDYVERVERSDCAPSVLASTHLQEQVLYIVTTMGVPLKVAGGGKEMGTESCARSIPELALRTAK